jgi:hypothetical protein
MRAEHLDLELFSVAWFNGNVAARDMAVKLSQLANLWDDIVDKDEGITEADVNLAFEMALVHLPANPFYASIQQHILPLWLTAISGFRVANLYEKAKDSRGLEIGHNLRFVGGHIIAYAMMVCFAAHPQRSEKLDEFLPQMWKLWVNERFDDYVKEHLNA